MPIIVVFFVLFLSACSSVPDAGAVYQTRFDFSQVKTYSMYERNSEFREFQSIDDITRNGLELAIERAMDDKGFLYSNIDLADLIVSYHIIGKGGKDYALYNKAVLYCDYCLRANTWQTENKNWKISVGSLILDFVDPKTKRSVWRGVSDLDIDVEDNSRKSNEKIIMAIKSLLALYPNA
jgi:glutaredoxin